MFWRRVSEDMKREVERPRLQAENQRVAAARVARGMDRPQHRRLEIDGFTILTDPVFSTRIGLNLGP